MVNQKINVYIADDHTFVRVSMIRLLKTFKRVGVVKEAANGKELARMSETEKPDIIILDLKMPVWGGITTARYFTSHMPDVKILILSMHSDASLIHDLMDIGVHGFLHKDADPAEVEKAIYSIIDTNSYSNTLVEKAMKLPFLTRDRRAGSVLTTRETDVVQCICDEMTYLEASVQLKMSYKTFFNHRENILRKLNVRSNVGIVKYAIENGLYDIDFGKEKKGVAKKSKF
jgi:two-component system, NarL family, response regulator DegU